MASVAPVEDGLALESREVAPRPAPPVAAVPQDGSGAARPAGALLMSAGTLGSGVLAYAFNAVAARTLGPTDYGPIAVLWAVMFLIAVVLFRPIEQTLSRSLAERRAAGQDARGDVRTIVRMAVALTVLATVVTLALYGPITDRLFDGQGFLTAMLAAGVAGYGASYVVRGIVGGARFYAGYGALLLADGGVRLAVALGLFLVVSPSLAAAALAAAAIAGAVVPLLMAQWRGCVPTGGAPADPLDLRRASRFAGTVGLLAVADQILLSGGPVLVMLQGGKDASKMAGVVFAATMLVRAPAYLFQGVAAALLPNLTTMLVQRDERRFRAAVSRVVLAGLAFTAVTVLGALVLGPWVMELLYGSGFSASGGELAILAAGAGGYLVAATLTQAALARSEPGPAAAVWSIAAIAFVALELTLPGAALSRVAVAFCVAALAAAMALWALSMMRRATPLAVATVAPEGA
jgi:O-antigen/teichoic acid export membrane protein